MKCPWKKDGECHDLKTPRTRTRRRRVRIAPHGAAAGSPLRHIALVTAPEHNVTMALHHTCKHFRVRRRQGDGPASDGRTECGKSCTDATIEENGRIVIKTLQTDRAFRSHEALVNSAAFVEAALLRK